MLDRIRPATARSPRHVLAILLLAVVGFAFQQTAIVPAVQTVQQSLSASREWAAWLVTVYLIVATIATPAMGRLGDLHGRRRMLLVGLAVFVVGSIGCAAAPTMAVLVCWRAVQGVGGSVYPLCLAIARENVPGERLTGAIAVLSGAFGLGTAAGFVTGGVLAQYASWRWIFVAGAVLVAAAALLVCALPEGDERATGSYDGPGTVVSSVSAIALLTALTLVVPLGWAAPATLALLAVAGAAALGWVRIEATRADPLIDVHVLRQRRVAVVNIGLGWALFSSYLLVPTFLQRQLGTGAVVTGLVLLPLAIMQTVAGPAGGWLSARAGARTVFAGGLLVITGAMALLCLVRGELPLAGAAALLGAGAGLGLQASSNVATQGVAADVAAVSSAVNSTVRRLAGGIGGQVSTIIIVASTRSAYEAAYVLAGGLSLLGAVVLATAGRGDD